MAGISLGSDFDTIDPINCDICLLENTKLPAEGYCTNCLEYLCLECLKNHCKPKPTRRHKLVGKDRMPKRQISTEVVDNHCGCSNEENAVTFFCKTHHKALCANCITKLHKECTFMCLSECAKDTEISKDYLELLKELDDSENLFKLKKDTSCQYNILCNESFKRVFENIDILKRLLQGKMVAVNKIENEARKKRDEYAKRMQNIEQLNGNAVSDVRVIRGDLSALQDMAQCQTLFLALQRSKSILKKLENDMAETNAEIIPQTYRFISNDAMKNMLINATEVGELIESSDTDNRCITQEYPEIGFPKCTALSDNSIVIINYIYNTLTKIVDGKSVAQMNLSSGPWDIAKISCEKVVITQPSKETVAFINLENDTIRINKEIKVNCRCEGIAYDNDKLFIASSQPACLVIYDTAHLNEETRISTGQNGICLFQQPAYINIHPEKHLICMSDRKSNKVFVFNLTGTLTNVFECSEMKAPLAVAFRDENVVVLGFESNTITKFSLETNKECKIETQRLDYLDVDGFFNDPNFRTNSCWKYFAGKYFSFAIKN